MKGELERGGDQIQTQWQEQREQHPPPPPEKKQNPQKTNQEPFENFYRKEENMPMFLCIT